MHRDREDEAAMNAWRFAVLQTGYVHRGGQTNDETYWIAQNLRQAKKKSGLTMTFTCLQKIYSVLHYKSRHEKSHGETSISVATLFYPKAF